MIRIVYNGNIALVKLIKISDALGFLILNM